MTCLQLGTETRTAPEDLAPTAILLLDLSVSIVAPSW